MKIETYDELVEYLIAKRSELGYSMEKVERLSNGITSTTVQRMEHKRSMPSLATLLVLLPTYHLKLILRDREITSDMDFEELVEDEKAARRLTDVQIEQLCKLRYFRLAELFDGMSTRLDRLFNMKNGFEWRMELVEDEHNTDN